MSNGHFRLGLLAGLVAGIAACFAGLYFSGLLATADEARVGDALEIIEGNYWKDVDGAELDEASIQGMVDTLREDYDDEFSHYFSAEQLREFEVSTTGRFSGVGLTVKEVPPGLRVAAVIPDSPADLEGIEKGELITAVDGEPIAGVDSDTAIARIKGPSGSTVELSVTARGGERREVEVERAEVRLPAVDGRMVRSPDGERIGYVRFTTFSAGAHAELYQETTKLLGRGAEGIVLDMRGNGGGQLDEARLCSSIFVPAGETIVSTSSRTQGDRVYEAEGDPIDPGPMVVLTDGNTASSSEIMIAALRTYDIAETVGTRTFGKGVFQQVIQLPQGGALDLTIGEFLAADGTSLAGVGIPPDHRVADDPDTQPDEGLDEGLDVLDGEL